MDVLETQTTRDETSNMPRARRYRDEEWEAWRELLIRLYMEDDVSRKDLVSLMANEHHFMINEKQLKHRFKKWEIKKYIPDRDMAAMLSFRRKRGAAGEHVTFDCRGHEVGEERLNRAAKRRKNSLPADAALPSHITASIGPNKLRCNDAISGHPSAMNLVSSSTSSLVTELGKPWNDSHLPASSADLINDLGLRKATEAVNGIDVAQTVKNPENVTTAGCLLLGSPVLSPAWDIMGFGATSLHKSDTQVATPRQLSPSIAQFMSWSENPYNDIDWSMFLNLPPSRAPSADRTGRPIETSQDTSPSSGALNVNIAPAPIEDDFEDRITDRDGWLSPRVPSANSSTSQSCRTHEDIGAIMLPLQLLYTQFHNFLEKGSAGSSSFGEHSPQVFLATARSEWLYREIEGLLCRYYELAATSIRQRRRDRGRPDSHSQHDDTNNCQEDQEELSLERCCRGQATRTSNNVRTWLKSNLFVESKTGTLKIHLRTASPEETAESLHEILHVSFIPATEVRTTGVTASFTKSVEQSAPHISKYITTFNVVPQDSAIIQCVSRNDLTGVRELFDHGQASPLDVDPDGFSLLSYAAKSGGLEVFLTLLRGGASRQNCDHYGSSLDIVWSIWFQYINHISHAKALTATSNSLSGDIEQCMRMTDAALDRNFDMEESVCYNSDRANVLFEMNECLTLTESDSNAADVILEFLINKGFRIEKCNFQGLTPLLHAVRSYRPQSLDCLKTFIRRGANVHARDLWEQGALHIALTGPYRLKRWTRIRHGHFSGDAASEHYWQLQVVYGTGKAADSHVSENSVARRTPIVHAQIMTTSSSTQRESGGSEDLDPSSCKGSRVTDFPDQNAEYILCQDYEGREHVIRHPIKVLKSRLQNLLLTLLQAGCDPNIVDENDETPSRYAWENEVWPQWCWALERSGYSYEEQADCWVKTALSDPHQTTSWQRTSYETPGNHHLSLQR